MSEQEFNWWLLVIFLGLLVVLGLVVQWDKANPKRTPLDEVLWRNGDDE